MTARRLLVWTADPRPRYEFVTMPPIRAADTAHTRSSQFNASTKISESRNFKDSKAESQKLYTEWAKLMKEAPGKGMNLVGKRLTETREKFEKDPVPYTGVKLDKSGKATATDVPNPDSPDGKWDPYQDMPRFLFHPEEDAFPVSPTFDGDLKLGNNGPKTADGKGNYQDGFIGGDQSLSGGFTVTKKGEYHVLTYSFYYATNKAVHYHPNDYSTAQVFLKEGKDGKLHPEYLATSWHHGSVLTPWEDLAKDKDGKPVVAVNLGSHALQPLSKGQEIPTEGLQIGGDGRAVLNGKPLRHKLQFDAFQTNVTGANPLDPSSKEAQPRVKAMSWGALGIDPFLPEVYQSAKNEYVDMGERLLKKAWNGLSSLFK